MAGSLSDYAENKLLDSVFRGAPFSPTKLYLALFTQGSGLEANNVAGSVEVAATDSLGAATGYARVDIGTQGGYVAAVNGTTSNAQNLEFATATGNWGTITHTAIMDAPAPGGNVIIWGEITNPRDIFAGDAVRVRAGANIITLD